MTSLTRGPLPPGVYWRRRVFVLALALALVFGVAQLLGRGSDGSSGDGSGAARLAGAPTSSATHGASQDSSQDTSQDTSQDDGEDDPGQDSTGKRGKRKKSAGPTPTPTPTPTLAAPSGPCEDSDIAVTPEVTTAVAGPNHGVDLAIHLRTITAEACTWKVSRNTLTLKITSGRDAVWSSRECPKALPATEVTVRRDVTTTVPFHWDARRSKEDCPARTDWALPGWYHVTVAALGGEPADVQFELLAPTAPQVTVTPTPKQEKSGKKDKKSEKKSKKKNR